MTSPRTPTRSELTVIPVPGPGAEDVLVAEDGTVYTGTEDGSIFAISPDGESIRRVANTLGRPLGLEWLPDGRLLVCDAHRGLLAIDLTTGDVELLANSVGGRAMRFCNNAAVLGDGTIYFSDRCSSVVCASRMALPPFPMSPLSLWPRPGPGYCDGSG